MMNRKLIQVVLLVLILALGVALLRGVLRGPFDADEIEHCHLTWCVSQDILPYQDIHQIHMPWVWMMLSPTLSFLPETVGTLVIFRFVFVLMFIGTIVAAGLFLRRVRPESGTGSLLLLALVLASLCWNCDFFRVRPDGGMTLFCTLGMLAALKLKSRLGLAGLVSGICLGLAATFSPKLLPVLFVFPFVLLSEFKRHGMPAILRAGGGYAAGGLLGAAPAVLWIAGKGIFEDWLFWMFENNAGMINVDVSSVIDAATAKPALLAVMGGLMLIPALGGKAAEEESAYDRRLLTGWWVAGVLVVLVDPNHLPYNWQIVCVPAAILLAGARKKIGQTASIGLAVALGVISFLDVWNFRHKGSFILQNELAALIEMVDSENDTCIGMAPKHPVFCRDATEIYLVWDYLFLLLDWVSPSSKQPYREMLTDGVNAVAAAKPDLVVSGEQWDSIIKSHVLTKEEDALFVESMERFYVREKVGYFSVWKKKNP